MKIWHAHVDTSRDQFDAYGLSKTLALAALDRALRNHARQCDLPPSWAEKYAADGVYADSVAIRRALMNAAYRYGSVEPLGYAP